ncbi:hypothetical protein BJ878DRAFT_47559 [Calycina marina]|uniref:Uncharacterized protein n=1 Tax=Calycina marina TaxID=1763456 RepID=A0A9P7Z3U9_9HELO|nr:hypothetical protein BJ878DRAFT_47559 [Calycina marina]
MPSSGFLDQPGQTSVAISVPGYSTPSIGSVDKTSEASIPTIVSGYSAPYSGVDSIGRNTSTSMMHQATLSPSIDTAIVQIKTFQSSFATQESSVDIYAPHQTLNRTSLTAVPGFQTSTPSFTGSKTFAIVAPTVNVNSHYSLTHVSPTSTGTVQATPSPSGIISSLPIPPYANSTSSGSGATGLASSLLGTSVSTQIYSSPSHASSDPTRSFGFSFTTPTVKTTSLSSPTTPADSTPWDDFTMITSSSSANNDPIRLAQLYHGNPVNN